MTAEVKREIDNLMQNGKFAEAYWTELNDIIVNETGDWKRFEELQNKLFRLGEW
jgi:hypothetical protein